ncbi:MAG: 7-carboxy-7-deazaguanine synthase QueE [Gammaproteobacteria bacterium]
MASVVSTKVYAAARTTAQTLRITEIFFSIQGESTRAGLPTVFVRLTGCPLRCRYCDTAYAFHGGTRMSCDAVLSEVAQYDTRYVTVTGGEPLAQGACLTLLTRLCDLGYRVSLETGGALDIAGVDARVMKVVDLKTPGSGEEAKNRYQNIQYLTAQDQIKIVICDREDYEWAKARLREITPACEVLLSPSAVQLAAAELADWILADRLPVRFQMQLHKVLWGDVPGR